MAKIGILGSGMVAQILGNGFLKHGHSVVFGTRDPETKRADLKKAVPEANVLSFAQAASQAEIVVMAIFGEHVESAVKAAGPENLAGKLVLDTSNPLSFGPNGAHKPASITDSCLQTIQRAAPKAHLVKAWNCVPGPLMVNPNFAGGPGDQFICGNDAGAKKKAAEILKQFGWNAIDVGDASVAPYVEGMGLTVINYGAKANDWNWGLKLLRK